MFRSAFRRRRQSLSLVSPEALETRELLSATACELVDSAVAAEVAPLDAGKSARKGPGLLTGTWSIDTEFGTLEIDSVQKRKKVRGTIDLAPANLSGQSGLPGQLSFLDGLTLPTIEYVGKFKGGVLQIDFKTTLDVPIFGSFKIAGSLSGTVDLASQTLSGHVTVLVNDSAVLDTDFSTPLPDLPSIPFSAPRGRRALK